MSLRKFHSTKKKKNERWALTDDQIKEIIAQEEGELDDVSIDLASLHEGSAHLSEDTTSNTEVQRNVSSRQAPAINNFAGLYKQKLKYETDMNINRFLGQVETYAHANGISDDNKMIALAIAALNQTDEGAKSTKILRDQDFINWEAFKTKLAKVLGHAPAYYVNKFNNFTRGSMKLGVALSELIECFRKGWQIEFRDLTSTEEEIIKRKFIHSLNGSLMYMLKTEEKKHNLDTLLDRAIELETCFTDDSQSMLVNSINAQPMSVKSNLPAHDSKQKSNSINNVSEVPDKLTDILQNLQNQHKEILSIQKQCSEAMNRLSLNNHNNSNFNNQNYNNQNRNHLIHNQNSRPQNSSTQRNNLYQDLNGLCIHYVRGNQCRYSTCRYKHTGPVSDALRKQFSKQ